MELVAASKMRKSVGRVTTSRGYADAAWELVLNLLQRVDRSLHPLLAERPVNRVAIVLISSNRGLCGSFNLNTVSKAMKLIDKEGWNANMTVDFFTLGKKGSQILAALKKNVVSDYPKDDITDTVGEVLPLASELISSFTKGIYDEVCVVYTHFISSLKQEARVRYLLPLVKPSRYLGHIGQDEAAAVATTNDFLFEPSRDKILALLLPRLVEIQLYQTVLESEASEHSARMLAMHNATDAATDMIEALTLAFNQARQAGITAELAEISAGAAS